MIVVAAVVLAHVGTPPATVKTCPVEPTASLTSCQGVHMECLRCVCMVYVRGVCQVCLASGVCVVCLRCACMVCLRGVRQVWDYRLNPTADIVHSHDFNRYLSPFKAEWDPKDLTESTVVVGR